MAFSKYVPGMAEGRTARNLVVGLVYLVTLPVWFAFLWLTLPFMVWSNTDDMAEGLSFLPGIGPRGGPISAAATFVYVAIIYVLVLMLLPGPLFPQPPEGSMLDPNATATGTPPPTPTA